MISPECIILEFSCKEKFLGVILDFKLSWKWNAESHMKKLYVPVIFAGQLWKKMGSEFIYYTWNVHCHH